MLVIWELVNIYLKKFIEEARSLLLNRVSFYVMFLEVNSVSANNNQKCDQHKYVFYVGT